MAYLNLTTDFAALIRYNGAWKNKLAFGNFTFLKRKLNEKLTSRLRLTVKIEVDISCAFTTPETTLGPFKKKKWS